MVIFMTKGRVKNILLVFLMVMNFVLGSRILIEKKLWPVGYNFFSNIGNIELSKLYTNIRNYFADDDIYKSMVFAPEKIVINTGDQTTRTAITSAQSDFDGIVEEASNVLKSALSQEASFVTQVTAEEVYSALASTSVYLEYPLGLSPGLFSKMLGTQNNAFTATDVKFSDAVIVHKPRNEVYLADREKNVYYRISVQKNNEKLGELVENCTVKYGKEATSAINYSFDLKFDKPFGAQKTTLNPFVLIYFTVPEYPIINAQNPIISENVVNEALIDNILRVFNINASTMRRYTEAGGTIVFVENNAILKLDKNGYLEYQATDGGFEISSSGDEHANIVNVASLASKINGIVDSNCSVRMAENEGTEKNKYIFDYIVSGIPVKINTDKLSSGIEAVVDDGVLKSYKQLIRKYEVTGNKAALPEFFTALDGAIAKYSESMNEINIDKMYFGYNDNGEDGEKSADWIVKVDNVIEADSLIAE